MHIQCVRDNINVVTARAHPTRRSSCLAHGTKYCNTGQIVLLMTFRNRSIPKNRLPRGSTDTCPLCIRHHRAYKLPRFSRQHILRDHGSMTRLYSRCRPQLFFCSENLARVRGGQQKRRSWQLAPVTNAVAPGIVWPDLLHAGPHDAANGGR